MSIGAATAAAGAASAAKASRVVTSRAKGFSRVESRPRADVALAADGGHRPGGLAEALLAHVVLELLAPDGISDQALEVGIGCTISQRFAQVGLVQREQAGSELALGCQPHPVA